MNSSPHQSDKELVKRRVSPYIIEPPLLNTQKCPSLQGFFLLIFLFSAFTFSRSDGTDLLDSVRSNSKIINDLKDIYRAYNVNHVITDQQEEISMLMEETDGKLDDWLEHDIKVCESLRNQQISNDTLKNYVEDYLVNTIRSYKIMADKGVDSDEYNSFNATYKSQLNEYMNYKNKAYSLDRFIKLSEEEYWQKLDKKSYVTPLEYMVYNNVKKNNFRGSLALLESVSKKERDFQRYAIFQIELADQYVKHDDILDNAFEFAIAKYKAILDEKKILPLLV